MPEVSNWHVTPTEQAGEQGDQLLSSWCHGATGIVLGRMAALPILDTPEIRKDVTHGLSATLMAGPQGVDTLCCGAMGRVEALVVASKELRDSVFLRHAHKIASFVLKRSRQMGRYALGRKKTPYIASFHQGMSGIGYELLRLSSPASLPSLLLWE